MNRLRIVPFEFGIHSYEPAIDIHNKIAHSGSGVDRSQDCFHVVPCFDKQVEDHPFWFGINSCELPIDIDIDSYELAIDIDNNIAPNGSGIDRSQDGIRVVPCFFKQI